jgi:hypothetical protein
VTIAKRPSSSAGREHPTSISEKTKAEYLWWEGWTGGIALNALAKSVFRRRRFSAVEHRSSALRRSKLDLICPTRLGEYSIIDHSKKANSHTQ